MGSALLLAPGILFYGAIPAMVGFLAVYGVNRLNLSDRL
jgi:hypothetical protein